MKYFVKFLSLDQDANPASCHGGTMTWKPGVNRPADPIGNKACLEGRLHACTIAGMIYWVAPIVAVIAVRPEENGNYDILDGGDGKVAVTNAEIWRVARIDGLQLLVDFAQKCADLGADYTPQKLTDWLVDYLPAGFLDGVEP
jgi:hypothetical protein